MLRQKRHFLHEFTCISLFPSVAEAEMSPKYLPRDEENCFPELFTPILLANTLSSKHSFVFVICTWKFAWSLPFLDPLVLQSVQAKLLPLKLIWYFQLNYQHNLRECDLPNSEKNTLAEAFNTVPDLVAVLVISMKTDSNQQNWSFVLSFKRGVILRGHKTWPLQLLPLLGK